MSERRIGKRAEQKRRWDRENRSRCKCGAFMSRGRDRCLDCYQQERAESQFARWDRIAALSNEGKSLAEIAVELETKAISISHDMTLARKARWDMPDSQKSGRKPLGA